MHPMAQTDIAEDVPPLLPDLLFTPRLEVQCMANTGGAYHSNPIVEPTQAYAVFRGPILTGNGAPKPDHLNPNPYSHLLHAGLQWPYSYLSDHMGDHDGDKVTATQVIKDLPLQKVASPGEQMVISKWLW